ncbi:hypothetical protein ACH4U7_10210 [Streptomyces sp. NPDC020845]|uniref:hypothetical protein n=1 Tax=Streptomyces sp. NPDC020845 TaxID=3365096 RepID=UPI0037A092AC
MVGLGLCDRPLEDRLSGIHACWQIWDESAEAPGLGASDDLDEDWSDEQAQQQQSQRGLHRA